MMMRRILIAGAVLLMAGAADGAEEAGEDASKTGNRLLEVCPAPEATETTETLMCAAFIGGVVRGWTYGLVAASEETRAPSTGSLARAICPPAHFTSRQMIDIVLRFLESRPELRHHDAVLLIVTALQNAWPCQD
jgi:Rap1a immunity proteins